MSYWLKLYADEILVLNFENLVQNFDQQTQEIFSYLGFDWNEDIRQFYKQKTFTKTASYDQVKQPINLNVLQQYQGYLPYLNQYKKFLEKYKIKF